MKNFEKQRDYQSIAMLGSLILSCENTILSNLVDTMECHVDVPKGNLLEEEKIQRRQ